VHTGADDTFCQAVQEGLAAGVPVVSAAAGSPLDLVRPGRNGLLYAPDDGGELRAAVHTLVDDVRTRRRGVDQVLVRGNSPDSGPTV